MWLQQIKDCICHNPNYSYYEIELPRIVVSSPKVDPRIVNIEETPLCVLKNKIINEYLEILDQLECGKHPDLEFLKQEISVVQTYNSLDNREFIIQHYINNDNFSK